MLDIDENSSVEDDMFENVKTDEDMDHEMEEEEGGSAFEEEIDPDESDRQEQAVIPKSQTPFLSDKDTPESYGELIGFMEKFIEDQKAENDAFRKEVKDSLSSTATDWLQIDDKARYLLIAEGAQTQNPPYDSPCPRYGDLPPSCS